jgi:alpha-galactosidase/6-phospho-beta-glucosidase family protein
VNAAGLPLRIIGVGITFHEAPVLLHGGQAGKPRVAELPPDIRSLVQRNAACEMLAVQAVVERDRDLALRGLLSNLMVGSYDQAKGLLDAVWPVPNESAVRKVKRRGAKAR